MSRARKLECFSAFVRDRLGGLHRCYKVGIGVKEVAWSQMWAAVGGDGCGPWRRSGSTADEFHGGRGPRRTRSTADKTMTDEAHGGRGPQQTRLTVKVARGGQAPRNTSWSDCRLWPGGVVAGLLVAAALPPRLTRCGRAADCGRANRRDSAARRGRAAR